MYTNAGLKFLLLNPKNYRAIYLRILELFSFFLKKVGYCLTRSIVFLYAYKQTFQIS